MNPTDQKTTPAIPIEGLPEGIEAYRFGTAKEDEFELVGGIIFKGERPGAASGVIVRPAKGFTFQPLKIADIRSFTVVDGAPGTYMVVKQEEAKTITATLKVSVSNSFDQSTIDGVLEALKGLPGFVSLERA